MKIPLACPTCHTTLPADATAVTVGNGGAVAVCPRCGLTIAMRIADPRHRPPEPGRMMPPR